jgi:uncharacterized protein (DUF362 family)
MDEIAVVKNKGNIDSAVKESIDLIGGVGKYIKRGDKVCIKPNLCMDKPNSTGVTTNPMVVESLARIAWEAGARDVIIGDGTTVGLSTSKVFDVTGYYEMARRCGARLVDLNEDDMVRVDIKDGFALKNIHVSREVLSSECVINVPMLKTHIHTTVTVSMKNMKGVISPRTKRKSHLVGLEGSIVDINRYVRSNLIVVDGIIGHEGLGPQSGDPVRMDLIIAGDRTASVDSMCARIMGVDPFSVKYLVMAAYAGLGEVYTRKIRVKGEKIRDVRREFKSAIDALNGGKYDKINIKSCDACSDCVGGLMVALKRLDEDGALEMVREKFGGMRVTIGKYNPDTGNGTQKKDGLQINIGKCQRKYKSGNEYIPGCPPPGFLIRDMIRDKVGLDPIYHPEEFVEQEEHIVKMEEVEAACKEELEAARKEEKECRSKHKTAKVK